MKTTIRAVLLAGTLLLVSGIHSLAIEGLQIAVQGPDVILSWPSVPGRNYIVQYRPSLDPSTPWVTLTNSLPADWTSNWTSFIHSNQVQSSSGLVSGMSAMTDNSATPQFFNAALVDAVLAGQSSYPLTRPPMPPVRTNGTWMAWEDVFGPQPPIMMPIPDALRQRVLAASSQGTLLVFDPNSRTILDANGSEVLTPMDGPQPDDSQPTASMGFYQVVQDGVQIVNSSLTSLTNGTLSGTVNIKFEAGNADPNNGTNLIGTLKGAVLFVDGAKFSGEGGVLSGPPWQFSVDTAYLENGDHWIQVEAFWYDPDGDDDGTESLYPSRYSDSIIITVSNAVSYPQWEEDIGEAGTNAAYFLKTTCANADWSIAIYDVNSNLVQTLTGHTDDGTIEAYWNMMDSNGVMRTNADVDPEFSSIVTVADPITKKTPKKKRATNDWPEHGRWIVTFQDYFRHWYCPNNDMYGHITEFALTAAEYGGYYLYYPPAGSTNDIGQTWPLRYQNPKHPEDGVTDTMIVKDYVYLLNYIHAQDSRNFFYRGHGNPSMIGELDSNIIKQVVGKRRYRFVLLQSCESADGDLDKAFGINGPGQYDVPYYQKSGRRPATFVGNHGKSRFGNRGHTTIGGVDYDGTVPWQVPYFYYEFLFYWDTGTMGWDLFSAMGQAMQDLPTIEGWGYQDQPGRTLKIYGYPFLHIDEFNYKTAWP